MRSTQEAGTAYPGIQIPTTRVAPRAVSEEGDPAGHVGHRSCRR